MTNEVTKPEQDGFAGYEDRIEGDDRQQIGGVIHGSIVKFTNTAEWMTRDGQELSPDLELVAVDIGRIVQKWEDQTPIETIILEPGQKFPNIEELNETVPRSEWTDGPNGKPRGPWQAQHIVYLLNMTTMDRFSYPTGTTGGSIAVRELVDRVKWMRRFRGQHIFPVISLSDTHMKTRFGGRQRPHFIIRRWVNLGPEGKALPAPTPELERFAAGPAKPAEVATADPPTVDEPTLGEQLNDFIPSEGGRGKSGRKAPRSPSTLMPPV